MPGRVVQVGTYDHDHNFLETNFGLDLTAVLLMNVIRFDCASIKKRHFKTFISKWHSIRGWKCVCVRVKVLSLKNIIVFVVEFKAGLIVLRLKVFSHHKNLSS